MATKKPKLPINANAGLTPTTPLNFSAQPQPTEQPAQRPPNASDIGVSNVDAIVRLANALNPPKPTVPLNQPTQPKVPEVFQSSDTGRASGVTIGDRTFLGLSPEDVQKIVEGEKARSAVPEGAITVAQSANLEANRRAVEEAIAAFGKAPVGPSQQLGSSTGENLVTGATSIPSIAGGATAGAGAGALVGGPVGAVIGGALGAGVALFSKISGDRKQNAKEARALFTTTKTRQTEILNQANSGQVPPADVILNYEKNLANVKESERQLKELTSTAVGKQLSQAQDELIQVTEWLSHEPEYRAQLFNALRAPNPNVVYAAPTETVGEETGGGFLGL